MYSINASLFWSTNRTPCGIVLAMQICVWTHPRCLWACVCLQAYAARRMSLVLAPRCGIPFQTNAISLSHTPLGSIVANNLPPNPRCASLSSNHEYDDVMAWRHGLALTQ